MFIKPGPAGIVQRAVQALDPLLVGLLHSYGASSSSGLVNPLLVVEARTLHGLTTRKCHRPVKHWRRTTFPERDRRSTSRWGHRHSSSQHRLSRSPGGRRLTDGTRCRGSGSGATISDSRWGHQIHGVRRIQSRERGSRHNRVCRRNRSGDNTRLELGSLGGGRRQAVLPLNGFEGTFKVGH
jgi:hypothetical protein